MNEVSVKNGARVDGLGGNTASRAWLATLKVGNWSERGDTLSVYVARDFK